ncbi:DUF6241 domain-containing protein [Alteribacter keqinensis]|uniref:Uncharacterized protein n=1 Tax=Alteribacter keqinensis TaxID=2483800 RepID=A0A3M7TNS6_9BACI|nr:DUF6241 domain-containing protein [Alteribacter keqinensis]RNA66667.1 hypothetical protein EBO34_15740 [Alteribacter keqinensis]
MKIIKVTAIVLVFLSVAGFTTHQWLDSREVSEASGEVEDIIDEETGEPVPIEEIVDVPTVDEVEERYSFDMSETNMQNTIHAMSHQKVYATEKWGHVFITDEIIDRLLEVNKENSYTHSAVYHDILTRWRQDDFSRAVEDHNTIWQLQGGTVGEATRLLSEEEERLYIIRHFEDE